MAFRGLSFIPDTIEIAGRALAARREKLERMTGKSDGWPYGYTNIYSSDSEIINDLEAGVRAVIGVGAQSGRLEPLFDSHRKSFTLKGSSTGSVIDSIRPATTRLS